MDDERRDRTLWCGNLDAQVTEELLRELFVQAGPVEDVKIPKDNTGRSKSFAFITFAHAESVGYTLALMDGISLYGRPIRMQRRPQATVDNKYVEMMARYCEFRDSMAVQPPNMFNCADAMRPSFAPQFQGMPGNHLPMGMPVPYQPEIYRERGGVLPVPEYSRNTSHQFPPANDYDRYGRDKDRYDRRSRASEPYGRYDRAFRSEKGHPEMHGTHRGPSGYDRRYEEQQRYPRRDYHERRRHY